MDRNSDPPLYDDIEEEEASQQNDSKILNPKLSENPTDMSDTTESNDNIEGNV